MRRQVTYEIDFNSAQIIDKLAGVDKKFAASSTELGEAIGRDISTKERKAASDADFVDVQNRAFPILKPADIPAAVHSFGRGKMPFDAFKRRLTEIARRKGWTAYLPKEWKVS